MTRSADWLTAPETTRRLGIKRATLYAYVSRGLIRSAPHAGTTRAHLYARDDVERLRRRLDERRDPSLAAAHALQLGAPVLDSALTHIADGRVFYRGKDAVALSRGASVADVAALLWNAEPMRLPRIAAHGRRTAARLPFMTRAQVSIAQAAPHDPLAFDFRPAAVARTGWRILALMTRAAAGAATVGETMEARLASAWDLDDAGARVVRAALILCADHELNVSAFTTRCIASAGGSPYGAVVGGLSALEGIRHGGMTARVETMLDVMRGARSAAAAVNEHLRRGAALDGFGHPLYPGGDPRAAELLALLRERHPRSRELGFAGRVADVVHDATGEHPSLDFALATVTRVLELPRGAGMVLFACGRSIGWIAHAIEQYESGALIRPRARYGGPAPMSHDRTNREGSRQ